MEPARHTVSEGLISFTDGRKRKSAVLRLMELNLAFSSGAGLLP